MSEDAKTFNFELVSPEEKLISEPASMVVIPGEEGDFGVLANHAATISSIRPGVIEVFANDNDEKPRRIFVAGGFADVSETNCTILAENAVSVDELDQSEIEGHINRLEADFSTSSDEKEKARIEEKIALEKAKLGAITNSIVL